MGPRVTDTGVITTAHLAILAILALLTIVGIVWGMRLQRRRRAARQMEAERIAAERVPAPAEAPVAVGRTETAAVPPAVASAPARPAPQPAPTLAPTPSPVVLPKSAAVAEPPAPLADEPIAAAAPLEASPATVATPEAAAQPPAEPGLADESVTQLKGLGPKVAARLADMGVVTIADMAALDATQAESIDARLGPFTGRMARDRWIEQARFLAAGDVKGFEAVFGRL